MAPATTPRCTARRARNVVLSLTSALAVLGGIGRLGLGFVVSTSTQERRLRPRFARGDDDGEGREYVGRFDGTSDKETASLPTSTRWSTLSGRVEGLVAELSQVVGRQDDYCVEQSTVESAAMRAVREKMVATSWGDLWEERKTMFSYGEEMSTDPLEAMMLKQLAALGRPKRVLEVGMFVGYGAVAMLEGAPSSQVVSLDIDPFLKSWHEECLADYPEVAQRHEIIVGPALETLQEVEGPFDMVFIDANKAEYRRYVEVILERGLLSPQGVIVADNILYNGYAYTPSHFDAQPARRGFGDAVRDFNVWVRDHEELEQVVLPIRDGVSIITRRSAPAVDASDEVERLREEAQAAKSKIAALEEELKALRS